MSDKTKNYIILALKILVSVLTVAVGVLFICAVVSIYDNGNGSFSRGAVSEAFDAICIPVYLWGASVLTVAVAHFALCTEASKNQAGVSPFSMVARKRKSVNLNAADKHHANSVMAVRNKRTVYYTVIAVLLLLGTVGFAVYSFNGDNFTDDINATVKKAMVALTVCLLPAFAAAVALFVPVKNTYVEENKLLTEIIKSGIAKDGTVKTDLLSNPRLLLVLRIAVVAIAVGLIAAGVLGDGMVNVLTKAINICTECIGLG